ncbi:MAG: hypothetical protein DCC75_07465 [Proteobacteria bacterium]|nr:MAG: hypothetical protein DCC75_07465 [Pseudomonadota bacterium]
MFALLLTVALSGCYSLRVERGVSAKPALEERQNYFLLGLVGENTLEINKICPSGVASVGAKFKPGDLLIGLLTVGIWTPRTAFVECEVV